MKIPISRPWFDGAEEEAVVQVLRTRQISQGSKVREFEKIVQSYIGKEYSIAVSSGTAALHIAVLAAGLGPGDEVLVPAFTWVSTINAVEAAGAKPIFCDIDPRTFNIDVCDAASRVTRKTRAIIPVHLFGLSADMTAVLNLSRTEKILTIEDAACALGSYYKDLHVGTFGEIGCFSFHPRKSITTGEGGMVVTSNPEYHKSLLSLRNNGSDGNSPIPDFPLLGFNYRMTELHAALGVTQMQKLNETLERRRACARRYDLLIADSQLSEWLEPPTTPQDCIHSFQAYVCQIRTRNNGLEEPAEYRRKLIQALFSEGIELRPGTHAPYLLAYYQKKYDLQLTDYPNALSADRSTIALPVYAELTVENQQVVCEQLQAFFRL